MPLNCRRSLSYSSLLSSVNTEDCTLGLIFTQDCWDMHNADNE
jgi:hypothetical protein